MRVAAGLFTLLLLLAGCGSRAVVTVFLQGDTSNVRYLRVRSQVDVAGAAVKQTLPESPPIESRLSAFEVLLPEQAQGTLALQVDGLRTGQCAIAHGETELPVDVAQREGVTIYLSALASPECRLSVRVEGKGAVSCTPLSVRSDQEGTKETLSTSCDQAFSIGEQVHVQPTPDPGWAFLGWSDGCKGRNDCEPKITAAPIQITASFVSTRLCNQDGVCWENPLPTGSNLRGIWADASGELWAVGDAGTILRNKAGVWFPVTSDTNQPLSAVWGAQLNDVWIVGACGWVRRWDGSALRRAGPFADTSCTASNPHWLSVWGTGPDDVWLSGTGGHLWRWDGKTWQQLAVPSSAALHSVRGIKRGAVHEVYAVGENSTLLRWNGSTVTAVPLGIMPRTLHAVWPESTQRLWIAGDFGTLLSVASDGSNLMLESNGVTDRLCALWGAQDGTMWAFGFGGSALRRSSGQWSKILLGGFANAGILAADGRSGDDLWAVGVSGVRARWNGSFFANEQGGTVSLRLNAVRTGTSGAVWIAGSRELLRRSGSSLIWESLIFPPAYDLYPLSETETLLLLPSGIWQYRSGITAPVRRCLSASVSVVMRAMDILDLPGRRLAYAVGDEGSLLEADVVDFDSPSASCREYALPSRAPLAALWAASSGDLLAVGANPNIYRMKPNGRGGFSEIVYPVPRGQLLAIHGSHPDNIWVAGAAGTLAYLRMVGDQLEGGAQVLDLAVYGSTSIRGVWARHELDAQGGIGLREVWAVGDSGLLLRARIYPGVALPEVRHFATGTLATLTSVRGLSKDEVWATGYVGVVLRYLSNALKGL